MDLWRERAFPIKFCAENEEEEQGRSLRRCAMAMARRSRDGYVDGEEEKRRGDEE